MSSTQVSVTKVRIEREVGWMRRGTRATLKSKKINVDKAAGVLLGFPDF